MIYIGDRLLFRPKKGTSRKGVAYSDEHDGEVYLTLDGDPFPIVLSVDQLENLEKGRKSVPTYKNPTGARALRIEARNLGVKGWEDMKMAELREAVESFSSNGKSKATKAVAAKKAPAKPVAKKRGRPAKAAVAVAEAPKKRGRPPGSKNKKSPATKAKATKKTPARRGAPKRPPVPAGTNPFRPGSNLYKMTDELMKGGSRSDMVKRLKKQIQLHPWSKNKEENVDVALDKRLMMTAAILVNDHGFKLHREGRGMSGTAQVTHSKRPPSLAKKATSAKVAKKSTQKRGK